MQCLFRLTVVLTLALIQAACGAQATQTKPTHASSGDPLKAAPGKVLFAHGKALADAGDFVRAEQYYRAAMARGFPKRRAIPYLVRACVSASRLHDALQHARPYLQEYPDDWRLRQVIAAILAALGEYPEAKEQLVRVIEDAPSQALPHYALAVLYRDQLEDAEQARTHFIKYLELAPEGRHASESKDETRTLSQKDKGKDDSV
jgi:tetratricopeptide (TPR) repeat protein